jgi:excisionase family DNA binding protein
MEERIKQSAPEVLLSTKDVADRLGVKPCTVRKLIERKQLNVVKVLGMNKFAPADVDAFIKKNRR